MKNSVARIVYYSILVALLLIALIVGLLLNSYRNNRWVKSPSVEKFNIEPTTSVSNLPRTEAPYRRYSANEIQNLDIDWTSGAITVEFGDTQDLLLTETGSEPMSAKLDGDTLKLQYPQNVSGLITGNHSKTLHILVPKDWDCRKLNVDTVSASLRVTDGTVHQLEFSTTSGSSRFENCALEELSIDSVSGSVVFSGTLSEFDIDGTSASAELDISNCPDSISMDTISGSMTLNLPSNCGFTAEHDSISGKYRSDFAATTHGSKQVHGDGACKIDFDGVSASLTIRDRGKNAQREVDHS